MWNFPVFFKAGARGLDGVAFERLVLLLGCALLVGTLLQGCATSSAPAASVDVATEERLRDAASAALESAHAAIKEARAMGWDDSGVAPLLGQAEEAFAKGQYERAVRLAEQVQQFALTAGERQQLILAKSFADEVRTLTRLTPEHRAQLAEIDKLLGVGDGPQALELSRQLHGALRAAKINYKVVPGDSLWGISGKEYIYADPYQWPLIYKANRYQIKDADLIYPGQNFDIVKHPEQGDVDAAVDHARHRGAWAIGGAETSDKDYLAK